MHRQLSRPVSKQRCAACLQDAEEAAAAAAQLLDICHLAIAQASSALASSVASESSGHAGSAAEPSGSSSSEGPAQLLLTALAALERIAPSLATEDAESLVVLVQACMQRVLAQQLLCSGTSPNRRQPVPGAAADATLPFLACARILQAVARVAGPDGSSTARLGEGIASACLTALSIGTEALCNMADGQSSAGQQAAVESALAAALDAAQQVCLARQRLAPMLLSAAVDVLCRSSTGRGHLAFLLSSLPADCLYDRAAGPGPACTQV